MFRTGSLETKPRLLLGTGKFEDEATQTKAIEAVEVNVLTFAVRRMNLYDENLSNPSASINLKDFITFPNTAGAKTAEEATRVVEVVKYAGVCDIIKVEVAGDDETSLPDPFETYEACKVLLEKSYVICPYTSNDAVLVKCLEELGVRAVMPLASPIGTGRGTNNQLNLSCIIKRSNVPVIVDADISPPRDACHAMELGADATLLNIIVPDAEDPARTTEVTKLGIHVGRLSHEAGRIPVRCTAQASNPTEGLGFL